MQVDFISADGEPLTVEEDNITSVSERHLSILSARVYAGWLSS